MEKWQCISKQPKALCEDLDGKMRQEQVMPDAEESIEFWSGSCLRPFKPIEPTTRGKKGCQRRTRGIKDQLVIDKAVVRNSRRRKTNLNVARIYFRKVYDMVPHSWILKTLELVGTAMNFIELLPKSM